jgi:hypothetical protein
MSAVPPYLKAKATKLPEGPDDTLEPSEEPTDATRRTLAPSAWPAVNRAAGPNGPPDRPAGPPPTDPAERGSPPFSWPRYLGIPTLDFDPDIALWPQVPLSRWPFTGPPTAGIWPLGWVGVDNTATLWVCTVGGQPGSWLPLGPGDTLGIVTPQQFGAVGDGVHDDTAAVLAAIAAASPGGTSPAYGQGGVLYFPPGVYLCSAALFYYPNTIWQGAGPSATQIRLAADLWDGSSPTPARFISAAGGVSGPGQVQQKNTLLRDLAIQGPGTNTLGQVTCHTTGLQGHNAANFYVDNLHIEGFFAGFEQLGNHNKAYNVFSTRNYYGLEYSDAQTSWGNDTYVACNFSGNNLASIHVGGAGFINTTTFQQVHLGFGPVGILKTDYQNGWDGSGNPVYTGGTASSQDMMMATTMGDISFEAFGNAAIIDMSTGAGHHTFWGGCTLLHPAASWSSSFKTTNAPLNVADYQAAWTLVLRQCDPASRFDAVWYGLTPPVGGAGLVKQTLTGAATPMTIFSALPPANFYGSGSNWSVSLGGSSFHQIVSAVRVTSGGFKGNIVTMDCQSLVNVGDCVELWTTVQRVQRATGTKPVFGVALTPSPGTQLVPMLIQVDGFCPINSVLNPALGSPLYLDTTTTYFVGTANTAGKVVGVAMGGTASSAYTQLMLKAA